MIQRAIGPTHFHIRLGEDPGDLGLGSEQITLRDTSKVEDNDLRLRLRWWGVSIRRFSL